MFRINRSRFLGIACLTIFIYFLVFTDSGSSTSSDFRTSTEAGLARLRTKNHHLPLRGDLSDEDLTKKTYDELQGILNSQSKERLEKDGEGNSLGRQERGNNQGESQDKINKDASNVILSKNDKKVLEDDEDPLAAGRRAMEKPKYPKTDNSQKNLENGKLSKGDGDDTEVEKEEDPGKVFAMERLTDYLKHPVVIFSKTFCPHSKRAKQLLLEIYNINPRPLVVELDMLGEKIPVAANSHEEPHVTLGKALQDLLAEISGRKTVPNIMVGGSHSIGGNDKIWELHESGLLAEEISKLGGRKIVSVDVHDSEDDGHR